MKKVAIITGLVIVMSVGLYFVYTNEEVIAVNPQTMSTTTVETVVEEVDVIDSAQAELDRINAELDQEETKLLGEIEQIEADAQARIDAKKARIEKIQETRTSFQSPRGLTE